MNILKNKGLQSLYEENKKNEENNDTIKLNVIDDLFPFPDTLLTNSDFSLKSNTPLNSSYINNDMIDTLIKILSENLIIKSRDVEE